MATKRKTAVDAAFNRIVRGTDQQPVEKPPSPLGVKLTQAEIDELSRIAKDLGVVRHHVLQYALRDFIARYNRGEKPELETKTTIILKAK